MATAWLALKKSITIRTLIVIVIVLRACETFDEQLHRGDIDPGLGAGNGCFEVFGEATVTIEPGEGAFDPAARQNLEADSVGHALDDLDAPLAKIDERLQKLVTPYRVSAR